MKKLITTALAAMAGVVCLATEPARVYYWFDNPENIEQRLLLPGFGEQTLDVSALSATAHTLYMLPVDENGQPGNMRSSMFLKIPKVESNIDYTCVMEVDGKLYRQQTVTPGETISLDLLVGELAPGFHNINAQIVASTGEVSPMMNSFFIREETMQEYTNSRCIYSIDNDSYVGTAQRFTDGTYHFDLDVASIPNGFHQISYMLVSPLGTTTEMKSAWFWKEPLGGNGVSSYTYWINDDIANATTREVSPRKTTLDLTTLIPVKSNAIRTDNYHFEMTNGQPYVYAKNDFHIMFMDVMGSQTIRNAEYIDYNVKSKVENPVVLVRQASRKVNRPATGEIKWFKAESIIIGDSLSFKADRACTLDVYSPSGEKVYTASGSKATYHGGFHAFENGDYLLALHDMGSTGSSTLNLTYSHTDKYAVLRHTPKETGIIGGEIYMELFGNGYDKLTGATLSRGGVEMPVKAIYPGSISETLLAFEVDHPEDMAAGKYNLTLEFDDGTEKESLVVADAIDLRAPDYGDIEVSVDYKSLITLPYRVTVKVKNTSNVCYQNIPLLIGFDKPKITGNPNFGNFEFIISREAYELGERPYMKVDDLFGKGKEGIIYPMVMPLLLPGETRDLNFTFDEIQSGNDFNIIAMAGLPWNVLAEDLEEAEATSMAKAPVHRSPVRPHHCVPDPCGIGALVEGGADCLCSVALSAGMAIGGYVNALRYRNAQAYIDAYGYDPFEKPARRANSPYSQHMSDLRSGMYSPADILGHVVDNCIPIPGRFSEVISAGSSIIQMVGTRNCPGGDNETTIRPVRSHDPNDIYGYEGTNGSRYVGIERSTLGYTIEFENDPEFATASAHHIVVTDVLDPALFDLSTFAMREVKISNRTLTLDGEKNFTATLDMRPEVNSIAQVSCDVDETTGTVRWDFQSLDPMTLDPTDDIMQGILPVNSDGEGLGFITFDIDRRADLADGKVIANSAEIVFDSNEAIETPVWENTMDTTRPESRLTSASQNSDDTATLTIQGTDTGSGIDYYTVYWQLNPTDEWQIAADFVREDSIDVTAFDGFSYGFCVVATDMAGNREAKTLTREVENIHTSKPGDVNMDGTVDVQDVSLVRLYFSGAVNGSAMDLDAADVNEDGSIDAQDAAAIRNMFISKTAKIAIFKTLKRK